MQKAEPCTRVTTPTPPSEVLAEVVQGLVTTLKILGEYTSNRRSLRVLCCSMRIAQIAPVWFAVPPPGYGGVEIVVSLLAEGLVDRGHDVTLFASGGSTTKARLISPMDQPPDPATLGNAWDEAFHGLAAYLQADEFDIIHDHSGIIGPALGAIRGTNPIVHTLHGPWHERSRRYYSLLHDRIHLVAISQAQRNDHPDIRYAGVVPNGIDLATYPLREDKEDFLLFLGRSNPEKGPEVAVEVAKRAGMHLKMIVKRSEPFEIEYWDRVVVPHLTGDEEILTDVSHAVKTDLLGRARATLFSIQWSEPFGLVMIESMACGTPVIATSLGSAPEVVVDGLTGFLCDGPEMMIEAVGRIDEINPSACREHVATRFSDTVMVEGYERIFEQVLGSS